MNLSVELVVAKVKESFLNFLLFLAMVVSMVTIVGIIGFITLLSKADYSGTVRTETTIEIYDPTVEQLFEYMVPRNHERFEVDGYHYFVL